MILSGRHAGREQHWHALGLALVPRRDQALGVLKHLSIGRASSGSFLLGSLPALILHFAAVEAHCHSPNVIKSPVLRDQRGSMTFLLHLSDICHQEAAGHQVVGNLE